MKTIISFLLTAAVLSSCLSVNVEEPNACKTNILTFTTDTISADAGVTVPTVSSSTQIDLSNMVSKLTDLGTVNLSVNINSLTLSQGDFSWLHHLTVTIAGTQNPVNYPVATLSDQDVMGSSMVLIINTTMDGTTLYHYLSQGAVELTFTATGSLPSQVNSVDVTQLLCVDASVHIHKGI